MGSCSVSSSSCCDLSPLEDCTWVLYFLWTAHIHIDWQTYLQRTARAIFQENLLVFWQASQQSPPPVFVIISLFWCQHRELISSSPGPWCGHHLVIFSLVGKPPPPLCWTLVTVLPGQRAMEGNEEEVTFEYRLFPDLIHQTITERAAGFWTILWTHEGRAMRFLTGGEHSYRNNPQA